MTKAFWTKEKLKEKSSAWFEQVPAAFQEDLLDVMETEGAPIFSRGMLDLREGVKNFELQA